ncbi:MAG: hypothetical protein IT285_05140 [Bdellovibrionales bacterium]|nr:hypothetical protein [Bdellovibrionales bacterium]
MANKVSRVGERVVESAQGLRRAVAGLRFGAPAAFVYHPIDYAWAPHEMYLRRYASGRKRVLFLGMNPGPFGMVQTGVPFGEVASVKGWLEIEAPVGKPRKECAKRPVEGFACRRSEVSGRRLWGFFEKEFGSAPAFFEQHFVANYCPLAFLDEGGRNLTPDKLPAAQRERLLAVCDEHLRELVDALGVEWVVGVGDFAEKRARLALAGRDLRFGKISHPSPASPKANRGWDALARKELLALGLLS